MSNNDNFQTKADNAFANIGNVIYRFRWLVLILFIGLSFGALTLSGTVRTDNSFDAYFQESDSTYKNYINYQKDFGSDEVTYILYNAPDKEHGPFDMDVMEKITKLTQELENTVPFVEEVTSLSNVEFIDADGDSMQIRKIELDFPENQQKLLERRDSMLDKPIYINSLVNKEGSDAAIIIEMSRTSSDPIEMLRVDPEAGDVLPNLYPQASNQKINEILAKPEYAGISFYRTGDVPMNANYNEIVTAESETFILLSIILVAVITIIAFRLHLATLFGPILVVLLGVFFTLAFMGVADYSIGLLFLIAPVLITAIGAAQCVHFISEFQQQRRSGETRQVAVRNTLSHVGLPSLLAALTTAAGFFAMSGSKIKAVADLSIYLGVGVIALFFITVIVMIVFLSFGKNEPVKEKALTVNRREKLSQGILSAVYNTVIANPKRVIMAFAFLLVIAVAGLNQLKVSFNFITDFNESATVRVETEFAEDKMGGILNVVYVFNTEQADGVKSLAVLEQIEALQNKANEFDLVSKTYSIVDLLKDINQSFHGGDKAYHTLPESDDLVSQYLLMYEISGGEDLDDYLSGDYSKAALELRVQSQDSYLVIDFMEELNQHLPSAEVQAQTAKVEETGVGALWMKMADYIAESQISGYFYAFVMIAVLLCLVFGSVKVGLISMIPNLVPIVIVLGYMGWAGLHLDYFRLLIATVAIGIAVDDSVHMMLRLRREFFKTGNYAQAIKNSLQGVGAALMTTSVILVVAFSVYLTSQMNVLGSFGSLLTLCIVMALLADLFLLPALMLVLKPFGKEFKAEAKLLK